MEPIDEDHVRQRAREFADLITAVYGDEPVRYLEIPPRALVTRSPDGKAYFVGVVLEVPADYVHDEDPTDEDTIKGALEAGPVARPVVGLEDATNPVVDPEAVDQVVAADLDQIADLARKLTDGPE